MPRMPSAMSAPPSYEQRPVNPDRLAALRTHAGGTVLDVGCGNGSYVFELTDRHVIGADYAAFGSWGTKRSRFVVAAANHLPFRDSTFETVSCFETLEHLDDAEAALQEFARVSSRNVI